MAGTPGTKGNPASKRMQNKNLKIRRENSWLRGQRRKAERVKAQQEREVLNRVRREEGTPTPWEEAKAKRAERRRNDPAVQKRAAKYKA